MIANYGYSKKELLKIFGLSEKDYILARLRYCRSKLNEYKERLDYFYSLRVKAKKKEKWFVDMFIDECLKLIEKEENAIKFLEKRKKFLNKNPVKSLDDIKEVDLDEIKKISISDYLKSLGYKPDYVSINREFYRIRKEKQASCCVYKDSNSWYDFGAGIGGTIIDLVMFVDNCDVKEAIKKLRSYV